MRLLGRNFFRQVSITLVSRQALFVNVNSLLQKQYLHTKRITFTLISARPEWGDLSGTLSDAADYFSSVQERISWFPHRVRPTWKNPPTPSLFVGVFQRTRRVRSITWSLWKLDRGYYRHISEHCILKISTIVIAIPPLNPLNASERNW